MAYDIAVRDGIICTTFTGALVAPDLEQLLQELAALEAGFAVTPHRLSDLSACQGIDLDYPSLAPFATARTKASMKNRVKSALVAPRPLHYGFARMFGILNNNPDIEIRTFADAHDAWNWLTA